jgi:beta-lactam-binding protein with PASTA domain
MIILSEPTDSWPTIERDTLVAPPPPPPPLQPQGGPPPDRRIGAGMLLALGAIVLVVLGALIAWVLTHRNGNPNAVAATTVVVTTAPAGTAKVVVPRLIGMKEEPALVRLGRLGLRATEIHRPSPQPAGVVIAQRPREASQVAKGSRVTIVLDSAPAKAATTASTSPAATTSPATTTSAATTGPTTTAATTTPATTASPPPQPQSATMPDVQGRTESSAVQSLWSAGILASLVFVPGTDTLGTVVQQAKPSGTTMPFHSHVQLNVSRGPHDNPLQAVPSVIGKTLTDAVSSMQAAHLRLIYLRYPITSRTQAGRIVQQSPLGGGKAPQNAQVLVYLGVLKG